MYVDGFNLYYGGRGICGRSTPGWRWLNVKALVESAISNGSGWVGDHQFRTVFCTARIKGRANVSGQHDQDVYLRALKRSGVVDVIEEGTYVERLAVAPLATPDRKGRPVLATSSWPLMVRTGAGDDVPDATFMVSVSRREEKGSDVNVATHLMVDVLRGDVDAAVVVSNDSDLKLPVEIARGLVPVGLVNPTKGYRAGSLKGQPTDGVGGHWWYQLTSSDFQNAQMSPQVHGLTIPPGW